MQPGIHRNVCDADYFALKYASKSSLAQLMKSPYHLRRYLDGHTPKPSEAQAFGTAVDKFITDRANFDACIAIRPECDRRTKEGKAIYEAFAATLAGKTEIKSDQFARLPAIHDAIMRHDARLLTPRVDGKGDGLHANQVTVIAEIEGVMCRARLDGWSVMDGISTVWDLKTCADIEGIERDAIRYDYIIQAAMYSLLMETLDVRAGREARYRPFKFIFVQSEPDEITGEHPVETLEFDQDDVNNTKGEIVKWLKIWKQCETANSWPRRPATTRTVKLSPWQSKAIEAPNE